MKLIEQLFDEEGIPVVWEDETVVERKARSQVSDYQEGKRKFTG
jgi:hypothetical protein